MAAAAGTSAPSSTPQQGKLLFIERGHPAVPEAIRRLISGENHVANCAIRDFDGNEYFIDFADEGATLTISIRHAIPTSFLSKTAGCETELKTLLARRFPVATMGEGVRVYPTPLEGMVVTVGITTAELLANPATVANHPGVKEASALRQTVLQAVMGTAFDKFLKTGTCPNMKIPYRGADSGGEFMYVFVHANNFNVSMNLIVPDVDDRLFAKSFLQTFNDARKLEKSIGSAPSFLYSPETAPAAFAAVGFPEASSVNTDTLWVTFVLSKKNMEPAAKAEVTVQHVMNFRTYLFYHIQTCRSFMHSKMRERMTSSMQVLNRAKTKATGKAKIQIA